MLSLFLLSNILSPLSLISQVNIDQTCTLLHNHVVHIMLEALDKSTDIQPTSLTCSSVERINQIKPENVRYTTSRRRGVEYVCISDSSQKKRCLIKLAVNKTTNDPDKLLCSLLNQDCSAPINGPLTETVERLYLRPSSLIR